MKEYTEIKISNSDYAMESILGLKEQIVFAFEEKHLNKMSTGIPIELVKSDTIKFLTQGHYEGLALKDTNNNPTLVLFEGLERRSKIGDGQIVSRYFEKTKKEDFEIKEELGMNSFKEIKMDLRINEVEKKILELGNTPISIDDNWYIFAENNVIRCFRNWTGIEMFRGKFLKDKTGDWVMSKAIISAENALVVDDEKLFYTTLLLNQIKRINKLI